MPADSAKLAVRDNSDRLVDDRDHFGEVGGVKNDSPKPGGGFEQSVMRDFGIVMGVAGGVLMVRLGPDGRRAVAMAVRGSRLRCKSNGI